MDSSDIAKAILLPDSILDSNIRLNYRVEQKAGRHCNEAVYARGGFCTAFHMYSVDNSESQICFRIWHTEQYKDVFPKVADTLMRHLKTVGLPYFTTYKYIPRALRVNGQELPGIQMGWIDGLPLNDYIESIRGDISALKRLSDSFMTMCRDLHNAHISHGDLSNSNILVGRRGHLMLIDYDSLYVPGMGDSIPQTTAGQPAFQHPLRLRPNHGKRLFISPDDDNFSGQVIYLSLLAIAKEPSLANMIGEEDLIFNALDLSSADNLRKSNVYIKLMHSGDNEIVGRLQELEKAISSPLSEIRSIVEYNNSSSSFIKSTKEILTNITNIIMAKYCHKCGYRFGNKPEKYCPNCGEKRIPLNLKD